MNFRIDAGFRHDHVGASSSTAGSPVSSRGGEAFVKLQVDVDEVRGMW